MAERRASANGRQRGAALTRSVGRASARILQTPADAPEPTTSPEVSIWAPISGSRMETDWAVCLK